MALEQWGVRSPGRLRVSFQTLASTFLLPNHQVVPDTLDASARGFPPSPSGHQTFPEEWGSEPPAATSSDSPLGFLASP